MVLEVVGILNILCLNLVNYSLAKRYNIDIGHFKILINVISLGLYK